MKVTEITDDWIGKSFISRYKVKEWTREYMIEEYVTDINVVHHERGSCTLRCNSVFVQEETVSSGTWHDIIHSDEALYIETKLEDYDFEFMTAEEVVEKLTGRIKSWMLP